VYSRLTRHPEAAEYPMAASESTVQPQVAHAQPAAGTSARHKGARPHCRIEWITTVLPARIAGA
jgi:hypothetical protein